jgi:hypothetical protein
MKPLQRFNQIVRIYEAGLPTNGVSHKRRQAIRRAASLTQIAEQVMAEVATGRRQSAPPELAEMRAEIDQILTTCCITLPFQNHNRGASP